jgi:hypothetical protein
MSSRERILARRAKFIAAALASAGAIACSDNTTAQVCLEPAIDAGSDTTPQVCLEPQFDSGPDTTTIFDVGDDSAEAGDSDAADAETPDAGDDGG